MDIFHTLRDLLHNVVEWLFQGHEIVLFFIGLGTATSLVHWLRSLWQWLKPNQTSRDGVERIPFHFRTEKLVHIFGRYYQQPTIVVKRRFKPSRKEKEVLKSLPDFSPDDPHAVLIGQPDWTRPSPLFEVESLLYSEVKAHILTGEGPMARITANAVIVCRERKQLVLHHRSKKSDSYKGCLHTMGGGYMPPKLGPRDDSYSLKDTIVREVQEESHIQLAFDQPPPMLIMEEIKTGFIQVAFLGINISAMQADQLPKNPNEAEGQPITVNFSDLPDKLLAPDWVPTGKAAILAWLALGAPGAGWHPRFKKYTARQLFEEIVSRPHIEPQDRERPPML